MGWFDNEDEGETPNAGPQQSAPRRPVASAPAPAASASGSTLGRKIHVDGTIVCDEDLTILGRVDGTIRAKGTLVIAKEADVRAKIDGQRVLVHGKLDGDVQGAERVVLGQTARLTGNIKATTLEIIEGAYFKGSVEMQAPKVAKPDEPAKSSPAQPKDLAPKEVAKADSPPRGDAGQPQKPSAGQPASGALGGASGGDKRVTQ